MAKALSPELVACFSDRRWRLNNLYYITDKHGAVIKFKFNPAQDRLLTGLHYLNIILKARQLGFCLDPATRVLTADLRWMPIEDLKVGTEIVAVDEEPLAKGKGQTRKMRTGHVQGIREVFEKAYRITFDDGRSVVCTGQHRWLSKLTNPQGTWRMIDGPGKKRLKVGTKIRWITKPWDDPTYEDGWFGGLVDGEGSISKTNSSASVNVSQRHGPVWDRMMSYGKARGYQFKVENDTAERESKFGIVPVPKMAFGRMDEMFRVIGQTRPTRFTSNRFWEGREMPGKKSGLGWATITSIEPLGEQRMIDLQTSTGTFIAEGFVSHNSTFILLLALDCCLFNKHFSAGLIADTLDNSKTLLERVKFAYERLPAAIQKQYALTTDNTEEISFANGSTIRVGTSLRSGTYNFIHISEYGKICAKDPGKADEIKTGALNTLAPRQLCFIESTAEGRGGDFYDKSTQAEKLHDAGAALGDLDYKFHFFPWYEDAAYTLDTAVILSTEQLVYFNELKAKGIELTDGQKWWYAAKAKEQGDGMWKEFPSTPDEAFKSVRDGSYFAKEMQNLRILKKIGQFEYVSGIPVNTHWDIGLRDYMSIWLHQVVAGKHRFIHYEENTGEGPAYYFDLLDKWRSRRSANWGKHYGPHDAAHKRYGSDGNVTTFTKICAGLGWKFEEVPRTLNLNNSIQVARNQLPNCEFDEVGCATGIIHLESYSKDWDDKFGIWKSDERHDEHSHAAHAFMTFSDGFKEKTEWVDPWKSGQNKVYA